MSTADELRELREVAGKLFGVTFAGAITGDPSTAAALIQAQALHRLADALAPLERIAGAMEANRVRGEEPMPAKDWRVETKAAQREPEPLTPAEPVASSEHWRTGYPSAKQTCNGWVEVRDGGQPAALPDGRMFRVQHRLLIEMWQQWAPMTLVKSFTLRPDPATPGEPTPPTSTPQEPPQSASATPGGHPLDQGGWIRSRVPTEEDGDEDGDVRVLRRDGKCSYWCHWSTVVLGQPWVRCNVCDFPSAPAPLPAHIAYPTSEGWIHDRVPGPEDADEDEDVEIAAVSPGGWLHWSHVVPGQPWRPLRTTTP